MEEEKSIKKVKVIPENGCSRFRWILTLVLSLTVGNLVGGLAGSLLMEFPVFKAGGSLACVAEFAESMMVFFLSFWMTVLFIKWIARTSFRSFVLGTVRIRHTGETWKIIGLYVIGLVISTLLTIKNIRLNTVTPPRTIILTVVISLIFTWFQTTTEEMWFRGIFARFAYGDNIKKGFCAGTFFLVLVSSGLFMAMHLANPEVLSSKGSDVVFAVLSYIIPGIMWMVVDLYMGTLEAGMGLHWINNLIGFTLISSEVSAVGSNSIFVDYTSANKGMWGFIATLVANIPVLIYVIIKSRKKTEKPSLS